MMLTPEQYIMLNNEIDDICVRVYIRNTYYLCVIEDKKIKSDIEYDRFKLKLLPRLDLVVGSFVYALHRHEVIESVERDDGKHEIYIIGKAWDKARKIISEITIEGKYQNQDISYKMIEQTKGFARKTEESKSDESEFINKITKWLFEEIAIAYENEV